MCMLLWFGCVFFHSQPLGPRLETGLVRAQGLYPHEWHQYSCEGAQGNSLGIFCLLTCGDTAMSWHLRNTEQPSLDIKSATTLTCWHLTQLRSFLNYTPELLVRAGPVDEGTCFDKCVSIFHTSSDVHFIWIHNQYIWAFFLLLSLVFLHSFPTVVYLQRNFSCSDTRIGKSK